MTTNLHNRLRVMGWTLEESPADGHPMYRRTSTDGEIEECIDREDGGPLTADARVVVTTWDNLDGIPGESSDYGVTLAEVVDVLESPSEYELLFLRLANLPGRAER